MEISPDDIKQLATLARLELTEAEVDQLSAQLPRIVDYVGQLRGLDTTTVAEPEPQVTAVRPDDVVASTVTEDILAQAPQRVDRSWKVDSVFSA